MDEKMKITLTVGRGHGMYVGATISFVMPHLSLWTRIKRKLMFWRKDPPNCFQVIECDETTITIEPYYGKDH